MKKKIVFIVIFAIALFGILVSVYFFNYSHLIKKNIDDDKYQKISNSKNYVEDEGIYINTINNEVIEEVNEVIIEENLNNIQEENSQSNIVEKNKNVDTKISKEKNESTKQENKIETKKDIDSDVKKQENNIVENKTETLQENTKEDNPETTKVEKCTNDYNHGIAVGNSGKWFNTKEEAILYYKNLIKDYGEKFENGSMNQVEYNAVCPYGYEVWSCMFCGKWTINFYLRNQ